MFIRKSQNSQDSLNSPDSPYSLEISDLPESQVLSESPYSRTSPDSPDSLEWATLPESPVSQLSQIMYHNCCSLLKIKISFQYRKYIWWNSLNEGEGGSGVAKTGSY